MLAKTFSATHQGIHGAVIAIEASRQRSLPQIHITGLPGEIIRESQERVRACLTNLGFEVPSARIVVHLSPASARKQGSQFDLAIALGVLSAEGLLGDLQLGEYAFLGELSLDGRIQRVSGALALVQALDGWKAVKTILVPAANAWESGLLESPKIRLVETLPEVLDFLRGKNDLPRGGPGVPSAEDGPQDAGLDKVLGQKLAKRALQVALAGNHHLLLIGSPGVGKSLLAQCAPSLLPALERDELIDVVKARHLLPTPESVRWKRPFRSPHHSISAAALLGGGSGVVVPGEVTLAHHGILFLDEFPEFRRDVIEGLREPLQNGHIHIHRIGQALELPARFTLIAAMNPCPCGYALSSGPRRCICPPTKMAAYRKRVSGPILDRLDLAMVLSSPRKNEWAPSGIGHAEVRESIRAARAIQAERYGGKGYNGDAVVDFSGEVFRLGEPERRLLDVLYEEAGLNFRSLHKIARVARTVADLAGHAQIQLPDLQEAWGLRCPELHRSAFGS
jgi:magnesium chelatase family protein